MEHSYRFSVAPMMDCTDRHFRLLIRQISRHCLLYSEMVVARALHHILQDPAVPRMGERQQRLERLIGFDPQERPLVLQLGGDDPALLAEGSRLAADWGYDEVNLNLGCPSGKVRDGNFGACLMAQPDRVARCVEAMATASSLPVTVKQRIGIDKRDSFEELLSFVDKAAAAGARRFVVHARKAWLEGLDPKQNRTVPPLRWDMVRRLKRERPELLVELNGGLLDVSGCLEQLSPHDGVQLDGVMVGRAAYAHPLRWASVDGAIFGDPDCRPVCGIEGASRADPPHRALVWRWWPAMAHCPPSGSPGGRNCWGPALARLVHPGRGRSRSWIGTAGEGRLPAGGAGLLNGDHGRWPPGLRLQLRHNPHLNRRHWCRQPPGPIRRYGVAASGRAPGPRHHDLRCRNCDLPNLWHLNSGRR